MDSILRISDAATLAIHAMVEIVAAGDEATLSVSHMAETLGVSAAHLSKVLQRLARLGLVRSRRGPSGGFILGKKADEVALLEILEAMDGPLAAGTCLLRRESCPRHDCIFRGLLSTVNQLVYEKLSTIRLSDLVE